VAVLVMRPVELDAEVALTIIHQPPPAAPA